MAICGARDIAEGGTKEMVSPAQPCVVQRLSIDPGTKRSLVRFLIKERA